VVDELLEHSRLKQAHDASVSLQVPDDARAIVRGRNCLRVLLVDSNVVDTAAVFLERRLEDLGLHADPPDADFTLHAAGDNALAVTGGPKRGHTVVMGVVYCIEQLARLW
jgi:hypothetical protein